MLFSAFAQTAELKKVADYTQAGVFVPCQYALLLEAALDMHRLELPLEKGEYVIAPWVRTIPRHRVLLTNQGRLVTYNEHSRKIVSSHTGMPPGNFLQVTQNEDWALISDFQTGKATLASLIPGKASPPAITGLALLHPVEPLLLRVARNFHGENGISFFQHRAGTDPSGQPLFSLDVNPGHSFAFNAFYSPFSEKVLLSTSNSGSSCEIRTIDANRPPPGHTTKRAVGPAMDPRFGSPRVTAFKGVPWFATTTLLKNRPYSQVDFWDPYSKPTYETESNAYPLENLTSFQLYGTVLPSGEPYFPPMVIAQEPEKVLIGTIGGTIEYRVITRDKNAPADSLGPGELISVFRDPASTKPITHLAYHGNLVVSADAEHMIRVWWMRDRNLDILDFVHFIPGPAGEILSLEVVPDALHTTLFVSARDLVIPEKVNFYSIALDEIEKPRVYPHSHY